MPDLPVAKTSTPEGDVRSASLRKGTVRLLRENGRTVVAFAGVWRIGADVPDVGNLDAQISALGRIDEVTFSTRELADWDSLLLVAIRKVEAICAAQGLGTVHDALPEGLRTLLSLTEIHAEGGNPYPPPARRSLPAKVGVAVQGWIASVDAFLDFLGAVTVACGRLALGRARFRGSDLTLILQQAGAEALPIVSLIAVLMGLILAFVGAIQLRQFGAEIYVANLVSIATLREMGAIMTAIIMAGRTGAAFAAELGTMQVNEEIDALKTLGFQPIEFLVLPRMLALVLMMPILCLYADVLSMAGGALIGIGMLDLPWIEYWNQTQNAITLNNFLIGVIKSGVFGVIVALAGCLQGMNSGRSAASVGLAATSAVVVSIVFIVVTDGLFAVALDLLGR